MEGFEVFGSGRGGRRSAAAPTVMVAKNGAITLNAAALALYAEHLPAYVVLLFHPAKRIVALQPAEEGDPQAYKLQQPRQSGSRTVGARRFFAHYGLAVGTSRSYAAYRLGDAVAFDLERQAETGGPGRPRRRSTG